MTLVMSMAFPKVVSFVTLFSLALGATIVPKGLSVLALSHVLFSIVAFCFLTLAALQASLVYIQNRTLKCPHRSLSIPLVTVLIQQLPPLQTMERLLFQMMSFGFMWLSASLFSAFLYIDDFIHFAHPQKIVLSACTWILFAFILYRHYRFGFRGLKAVQWTLIGLGLLTSVFLAQRLSLLKF
jgi:ABC-type uncharacterized transport system permease subunit